LLSTSMIAMRLFVSSLALLSAVAFPAFAQQRPTPPAALKTAPMLSALDAASAHYATVAKQIWTFAEVGYMEEKSSALLQSELKSAGFAVKAGVVGEPTALIA